MLERMLEMYGNSVTHGGLLALWGLTVLFGGKVFEYVRGRRLAREQKVREVEEALAPKPPPLKPGEFITKTVDPTPKDIEQGIMRMNTTVCLHDPVSFIALELNL